MTTHQDKIREKASQLGFCACGFAKAEPLVQELEILKTYIREKKNGDLHFLARDPEKRSDPRQIMPEAKSVIALLISYYPKTVLPGENNYILSKYAYGKDYHQVIRKRLNEMVEFILHETDATSVRGYVDTSPLLEKRWAQQCGLGWIGKNTLLINPQFGSFTFIGILLTDLEFDYDTPGKDRCGSCTKCLQACPTGALCAPHQLLPERCIAFHTLENQGEIPPSLKGKFNNRICGCDICQDVCPYNATVKADPDPVFVFHPDLQLMRKPEWKHLQPEQFERLFSGTPVSRIGYEKLMRNIRFNAEE